MLTNARERGVVSDKPWRVKANRVIAALCRQSYLHVNTLPNGQLRRKHVPYSVPEEAQALIECLNNNDEERAKEMFLHNYAIARLHL